MPTPKSVKQKKVKLVAADRVKPKGRILHLFSGPSSNLEGVKKLLETQGWIVDDFDSIENNDEDQNILRDDIWDEITRKIKEGHYDFVLGGPPCGSFSRVRRKRPGPPQLRSAEHPYGFPRSQLRPEDVEYLRKANVLAVRAAEAGSLGLHAGEPRASLRLRVYLSAQ